MLEVRNLSVKIGSVNAVRDVSLSIPRGEIHGLIGESGCGKSVTGLTLLGLLPENTVVTAQTLTLEGEPILGNEQHYRGRRIALVSQDPTAALNPVLSIARQMDDVLRCHSPAGTNKRERRSIAARLLTDVGLADTGKILRSYPHQLSGGMQQRVVIAQALATGADFLIADEPTTALDVSLETQVLKLLQRLAILRGLTILLITHDMSVVERCCKNVSVVYAGMLVESGATTAVLESPHHPYTKALLGALPGRQKKGSVLQTLIGELPDARAMINGCVFSSRCSAATEMCLNTRPSWKLTEFQAALCHYAPSAIAPVTSTATATVTSTSTSTSTANSTAAPNSDSND